MIKHSTQRKLVIVEGFFYNPYDNNTIHPENRRCIGDVNLDGSGKKLMSARNTCWTTTTDVCLKEAHNYIIIRDY